MALIELHPLARFGFLSTVDLHSSGRWLPCRHLSGSGWPFG
jgi:hypothetical protein